MFCVLKRFDIKTCSLSATMAFQVIHELVPYGLASMYEATLERPPESRYMSCDALALHTTPKSSWTCHILYMKPTPCCLKKNAIACKIWVCIQGRFCGLRRTLYFHFPMTAPLSYIVIISPSSGSVLSYYPDRFYAISPHIVSSIQSIP